MLTIQLFFVSLFVVFLTYLIIKRRNPKCNGVLPPGSMGLPFIGETIPLVIPSYSLDLHPFIKKRIQRYGPVFRSCIAGRPIIFSADTDFNHYIISQEGKLVEFWYMDAFSDAFVLDGESRTQGANTYIHKYIRRLFLNQFGSEILKDKFLPFIQDNVLKMLQSWSSCQENIQVKRGSSSVVCNSMAKFLFGYKTKNSSDEISESLFTILNGLMAFPLNVPGTRYHQCLKNHKNLKDLLKQVLKERLSSAENGPNDLLNEAIKEMEKESFLTEDFIVQLVLGGLLASVESLSTTITLLFKFLSDYPSVLQDLTVEQENFLKNRKSPNSPITWDEYKSMTFTLQVINEILRMGNITPGLLRRTLTDIPYKGYIIPAGWTVIVVTSAGQMNPQIFEHPAEFNPYRWKDLDMATISKNFTPFGGGTRQCAGAQYTKVFLAIFIHVLVTKYRWIKIKEGKIYRNPILGFKDDFHIKLYNKV